MVIKGCPNIRTVWDGFFSSHYECSCTGEKINKNYYDSVCYAYWEGRDNTDKSDRSTAKYVKDCYSKCQNFRKYGICNGSYNK